MTDLDRVAGVGDRRADQRLLDRTPDAAVVARADIPGGRRDDLVVAVLAVLDVDPVAQRAADRLGRAPADAVALGRLDVPRVLQPQFAQDALDLAVDLGHFVHA